MKYLVDTCGWIEWLTDGALASSFQHFLKEPKELIVPTIIQYELYKWICREKNITFALEVMGITESSHVVPLETELVLSAAEMSKDYHLAMADAMFMQRVNSIM